jgi:hypothetical protein
VGHDAAGLTVGLFSRRHLIERTGDRFVVRLDDTEREVLADVCTQLADTLEGDEGLEDVPALRRLFPTAHPGDPELDAEYRELAHDDLLTSRVANLRAVADGVRATDLDADGLERWMLAVNSVRLVFGTALDVGEEPIGPLDPDDPDTPSLVVYHFLGQVLDDAVTALSR